MTKRGDDNRPTNYQIAGEVQAIAFLEKVGKRPKAMTSQQMRAALSALPGEQWFPTTLADFWLGLTKKEGVRRRSISPPPSPFKKSLARKLNVEGGEAAVASRSDLEEWDKRWLARTALDAISKDLSKRQSARMRSVAASLNDRLPTLIDQALGVVGFVGAVPEDAFNSVLSRTEFLEIRPMGIKQALRMRWIDDDERLFWIDMLRKSNREEERLLERMVDEDRALKNSADIRTATPKVNRPGRKSVL